MVKRLALFMLCLTAVWAAAQTAPAGSTPAKKTAVASKTAAAKPAPKAAFQLPARSAGLPGAPIKLEVYSDFQCPACREFYLTSLQHMIDEYCATGKVYLVHHDLLIPSHMYSRKAAEWADASAAVGRYEAVARAIYTQQEVWAASGNIQAVVAAVLSPTELQKVIQVLKEHQPVIDAEIDQDIAAAKGLNFTETPTIKVSRRGSELETHKGPVAYVILKRFLDDQLTK